MIDGSSVICHQPSAMSHQPSAMTTMLHRFAKLVVACTVLLILAGSLVTSHDAGLSVPDWPTSYGWNMFTFPPSMWVANIFYEHGHRLIASTVGFLTIILATWLWLADARPWLKWFGAAALGAIIAQGVLGGLTVLFFLPAAVSTAHAALAEIFLCMTVAIALFTSPRWMEGYGTAEAAPYGAEPDDAALDDAVPYSAENPLVVSLSNHEPNRSSFDRPVPGRRLILRQTQDERRVEGPVLSKRLILRQAQDERRVEGLRTSECIDDVTLRRLATATTALIFLQIIIGAAMRHTGAGLAVRACRSPARAGHHGHHRPAKRACSENATDSATRCGLGRGGPQGSFSCDGVSRRVMGQCEETTYNAETAEPAERIRSSRAGHH